MNTNPQPIPITWYLASGAPAPDMAATMYGEWVDLNEYSQCAFDFVWPGTGTGVTAPTGTLSFQTSNDKVTAYALPGTISPPITQPPGTAGNAAVDGITTGMAFIRSVYTASSGGAGAVIVARVTRKI